MIHPFIRRGRDFANLTLETPVARSDAEAKRQAKRQAKG